MMGPGKKKATPRGADYSPRKTLVIPVTSSDPDELGRAYGEHFTSGSLAALRVVQAAEKSAGLDRELDLPGLLATLRDQAKAVNAGSLAQAEAMLMNQATALQSLFARLAERGMSCKDVVPFETNMRVALRAQSQCRATLEALAAIKNPPMVIAKQANVTTGPQQVNNGIPALSRAENSKNTPSKLMENLDGERLDTRTAGTASGADTGLETVGAVDRAEDR